MSIKDGNLAFERGLYEQSIRSYRKALPYAGAIADAARFNLALALKRLGISSTSCNDLGDRRTLVYTVLTGDYEDIKPIFIRNRNIRYLLFTDRPNVKAEGWEVVPFDSQGLDPRRASRIPKILAHRYLPDHDVSIYIDSSLQLITDELGPLLESVTHADIALYPHYKRDCVYDEINFLKNSNDRVLSDQTDCDLAIEKYKRIAFPRRAGLYENALIVRANTPRTRHLNEIWWHEYENGSERDQFTLMYALYQSKAEHDKISVGASFRNNPFVTWYPHKYKKYDRYINDTTSVKTKKVINWVIGTESQGWAYENNVNRLTKYFPDYEHRVDSSERSDIAVYFDTLLEQSLPKNGEINILRIGGMTPIKKRFGEDSAAISKYFSSFDAVIALNDDLYSFVKEHSAVHSVMIPNGLEIPLPDTIAEPHSESASSKFVVGFAGNCRTRQDRAIKGLDICKAACKRLNVELLVAKKGSQQIPHENMYEQFYSKIDCLVHPVGYGKEGASNVIMEALAYGVPVLTTRDCGFHAHHLRDGINVIFCERNETDIAKALELLQQDRDLRKTLSKNGKEFCREKHDIRDVAVRYREVLEVAQEGVAKRFRVAMITKSFWPKCAGMELMIHNLASSLVRKKHDVVLFAPEERESYVEIEHAYQLVRFGGGDDGLRLAFETLHLEREFDVIYVQGAYSAATLAVEFKQKFGVPVVLRTHGDDIQIQKDIGYGLRLNPAKNAVIIGNLSKVDANVSIGQHIEVETRALAPNRPSHLIHNGVDVERFSAGNDRWLRARLGVDESTKILLSVGRNVKKKSFHLAIDALAEVKQKYRDVVLVHVGKPGNGIDLNEHAKRRGVEAAFFWLGEVNYFEMPNVYRGADIFVFPAKAETFGNVTIEAMAAGLPCVEFDYEVNREKIIDGETGYVVEYGNVGLLAERILSLLSDARKRERFARSSIEHVRRTFSWDVISDKYLSVFDQVVRSRQLKLMFIADKFINIKGGGGEKSLANLVNAMADRGHEVHLVIKEKNAKFDAQPFYPLSDQVTLHNLYKWGSELVDKGVGDKTREDVLRRLALKVNPDLAVVFFLPEFGFAGKAFDGLDIPLILSHRNDPEHKMKDLESRYPKRKQAILKAYEICAAQTVQMEAYIDLLPETYRHKVFAIPNSVEPVEPDDMANPELESSENIIVNVGRLVGAKNQEVLIKAFAKIADQYPDWKVKIYGDGPLQEYLQSLIEELGLGARVFLMGTTKNIRKAYKEAKVFAFPSLYEGFSRAHSEAMMHGLPSIGIKTCLCSEEFIIRSGGGLLVANEVTKFAIAMSQLMSTPRTRAEAGRKARKFIEQYNPVAVFDKWEEAFQKVLVDRSKLIATGSVI